MVSADGTKAKCMRVSEGAYRSYPTGASYHQIDGDISIPQQQPRITQNSSRDWPALAGEYAKSCNDQLGELSQKLGVSCAAMRQLGVGWDGRAWTFPEKNAAGQVIGISRRLPSGKKLAIPGSRRGLSYASDWSEGYGPILLVEGGSDTAALLHLNLCAIGRPSNKGGLELLTELLKQDTDREIIVLGERDQKTNTKGENVWPGREGAISTATQLANALGRQVHWSLPPGSAKDVRSWLNSQWNNGKTVLALQEEILNEIQRLKTTIKPVAAETPSPKVLVPLATPPTEIPFREYQRELDTRIGEGIEQGGISVIASPTGVGKSELTWRQAAHQAKHGNKSLIVSGDSHSNCQGDLKGVRNHLPQEATAHAYPERDSSNCQNLEEANKALAMGLSVREAVCRDCPFKTGCHYLQEAEQAENATVAVVTEQRFSRNPGLYAQGRIVFHHEDCRNSLARKMATNRDFLDQMQALVSKAAELNNEPVFIAPWFNAMASVVNWLVACIQQSSETVALEISPEVRTKVNEYYQREEQNYLTGELVKRERKPPITAPKLLLEASQRMGIVASPGLREAMQIVHEVMKGEAIELYVQIDPSTKTPDSPQKHVVAIRRWKPGKRSRAFIQFNATEDLENFERLIGQTVINRTPEGRPKQKLPILQFPIEITEQTSSQNVARIWRILGLCFPGIGIITLKEHFDELYPDGGLLDQFTRSRTRKASYFRSGEDVGSNDWLKCCMLATVGTPHVPPQAIRTDLLCSGLLDDAKQNPEWLRGGIAYEATTTTGETTTVYTSGYDNAEWRKSSDRIVSARLAQAGIGRPRGILDEEFDGQRVKGIPAIIVSKANLQKYGAKIVTKSDPQWGWLLSLIEAVIYPTQRAGRDRRRLDSELSFDVLEALLGAQTPMIDSLHRDLCAYCAKTTSEIMSEVNVRRLARGSKAVKERVIQLSLQGWSEAGVARCDGRKGWQFTNLIHLHGQPTETAVAADLGLIHLAHASDSVQSLQCECSLAALAALDASIMASDSMPFWVRQTTPEELVDAAPSIAIEEPQTVTIAPTADVSFEPTLEPSASPPPFPDELEAKREYFRNVYETDVGCYLVGCDDQRDAERLAARDLRNDPEFVQFMDSIHCEDDTPWRTLPTNQLQRFLYPEPPPALSPEQQRLENWEAHFRDLGDSLEVAKQRAQQQTADCSAAQIPEPSLHDSIYTQNERLSIIHEAEPDAPIPEVHGTVYRPPGAHQWMHPAPPQKSSFSEMRAAMARAMGIGVYAALEAAGD